MRALFAIAVCCALGCGATFDKQSHIAALRVLAVKAEPAELILEQGKPPPSTTLTAFAVTPDGGAVTTRFALCTSQGAAPDPAIACPGAQGLDLTPTSSASARLDLSDPRFKPAYDALTSGPNGAPPEQTRALLAAGVPVVLGFDARGDGQEFPGLSTITLRTADPARPLNQNPTLAALQADKTPLDPGGASVVAAGAAVTLTPVASPDAHGSAGDPKKLNFSLYVTAGDLDSLRSVDTTATGEAEDPSVTWHAPKASGPVQVFVVVRDGRGGVGFLARTVQVQ